MADNPIDTARAEKLQGLGCSRKRVEDARFTQGKGNYVDDLKMPGMLFGDFVRSPYAHARVVKVHKDAALAMPGVIAVLTARAGRPPRPRSCTCRWTTTGWCRRLWSRPSPR